MPGHIWKYFLMIVTAIANVYSVDICRVTSVPHDVVLLMLSHKQTASDYHCPCKEVDSSGSVRWI